MPNQVPVPRLNFYELEKEVLDWAIEREIFIKSDAKSQALKTVSEVGEYADNVLKGRDCRDDIGDIIITLILQAAIQKTTLAECLNIAYGEIKNRKGKMVNGAFVKEVGEEVETSKTELLQKIEILQKERDLLEEKFNVLCSKPIVAPY